MAVRVLSWNLKHGRAVPAAGRSLFDEFAAALAEWEWDVALLQEVPPWWPPLLARRTAAQARRVLTSRNAGLAARRPLATRWPDVVKSNGGGANALLVRTGTVAGHRTRRLCRLPERRWVHGVEISGAGLADGLWVANLHATAHHTAAAQRDSGRAAEAVRGWANGRPAVLGGDFNLRSLVLPGFAHAGGHDVDHFFVSGLQPAGPLQVLERGQLSDHAPIAISLS